MVAEDEGEGEADDVTQSPPPNAAAKEVVDLRAKEADRVELASWPKPGNFLVWRVSLVDKVIATSSGPQSAFRCITALSGPGVTYEELADTSDGGKVSFATLDAKLGSALSGVAPSDFLRQVQNEQAEAISTGAMSTGRQISWLVDRHFRMAESDRSVYDTEHIFAVGIRGEDLRGFISTWDSVLVNLSSAAKPADAILETLFIWQTRKSKRTEVDVAH